MKNYKSFLIKYAEIGLKGKNRYKFEDALVHNIRFKLSNINGEFKVYKEQERIYIDCISEFDYYEFIENLKQVFGIFSISPIYKFDYTNNYNNLSSEIIDYINKTYGKEKILTFKVKTRRINKNFPMHSDEINSEIGHDILVNFPNFKVDVHNPQITIYIEIRKHINIYSEKILGLGGLPVNTNGKALLLLSGGIDSPVAGYMISKRGVKVDAIYFHAPPYTSDRAKDKVISLAKIISKYAGPILLHIINFTDIQLAIYDKCPHDELTIIMRRIMFKIADIVAKDTLCLGLVTGESIGQVASQTMSSMFSTNEITKFPVYRPLIGFDKEEIINMAKKINTFETSILPYEDCCTIFVAKHPVTNPKLDKIKKSEQKLNDNIDELINIAINTKEEILCK